MIADFTKSLMSAKRDLMGELPILVQVELRPIRTPDAYLPIHPGAAEYYNGTQQSFMDKWSNAIFSDADGDWRACLDSCCGLEVSRGRETASGRTCA